MKKSLMVLAVVAAAWLLATKTETFTTFSESATAMKFADLNGHKINLEVVSSREDITLGLGGRDSLPTDRGMLFLLGSGIHPFWMKAMRFPIDMIWLRDGAIVDIASNMPPPKTSWEVPATHTPMADADSVVEINAGQAQAFGLKVGSAVTWY